MSAYPGSAPLATCPGGRQHLQNETGCGLGCVRRVSLLLIRNLCYCLLPQAPWRSPKSNSFGGPMSFGAILISIAIGFGLIVGGCVLVFFGVAAMAREARD